MIVYVGWTSSSLIVIHVCPARPHNWSTVSDCSRAWPGPYTQDTCHRVGFECKPASVLVFRAFAICGPHTSQISDSDARVLGSWDLQCSKTSTERPFCSPQKGKKSGAIGSVQRFVGGRQLLDQLRLLHTALLLTCRSAPANAHLLCQLSNVHVPLSLLHMFTALSSVSYSCKFPALCHWLQPHGRQLHDLAPYTWHHSSSSILTCHFPCTCPAPKHAPLPAGG